MMAKKGAPLISNNVPPSVMNAPGQFHFLEFKQGTDVSLKSKCATPIIQKVTLGSLENNGLSEEDVSFGARTGKYSYVNHNDAINQEKHCVPQKWLTLLNKAAESWSCIYIPQCSADAYLG
eukprot:13288080-Ditylum_brightwellii.AAC.1